MNALKLFSYLLLLAPSLTVAQEIPIAVNEFGGLNNSVDPVVIGPGQAQDSLNVEINKTGTGVKKRDGYSLFQTIGSGAQTQSIFGFKNSAGTEILLFASSATLYSSANQATAVTVTTVTTNTRVWCQDSQGTAYCFTSDGDRPFTWDGTTYITRTSSGYPVGKFNAFTQDRQLISGTTDQPNRLYLSKSGDFGNFILGNTDVDSWTEDIGKAGDRITGLSFLNGRVIVWMEYSIGGFNVTDQFNSVYYDIAQDVGIAAQENIIIHNGIASFKGSDNEFYAIDGSPGGIEKLSVDISSTTSSLLTGRTRYTILTDKVNWDAGNLRAFVGADGGQQAPMASDIVVGAVMPSSATFILDGSSTNFNLGTFSSAAITGASIGLSSVTNIGFESGGTSNWAPTANIADVVACDASFCYGNWKARLGGRTDGALRVVAYNADSGVAMVSAQTSGGVSEGQLDISTFSGISRIYLRVHLVDYSSWSVTSSSFSFYPSTIGFAQNTDGCVGGCRYFFDFQNDGMYFSSGVFTSDAFDLTYSTPTFGKFSSTITYAPGTTLSFHTQGSATSGGTYSGFVATSDTLRVESAAREFVKYRAILTTTCSTCTALVTTVGLEASTTGQYHTQCIEPGSGSTSWGTLEAATSLTCGSVAFFNSTGTSCSTIGTPTTVVSTGATISIAVAAAYRVRVDFGLDSATCTARLDSLTANWNEGSVAPASYGTYWNDGLYWSLANAGTANNLLLKYDLLYGSWHPFDIAANGLYSFNNIFYFGSTTTGKVYKYSSIRPGQGPTSDDGANINAYWKSKEFAGPDPFRESQWNKISLLAKKQAGGTATATWQLNGGDVNSGSYTINLSTGTNIVRNNYSLPVGQRATFFNLKIANNSTQPFELLGFKVDLVPLNWRVLP